MTNKISCDIYLETRRPNKEGLFPINLRLYDRSTKKRHLYSLSWFVSATQFEQIWTKPKKAYDEQTEALETYLNDAKKFVKELSPFDTQDFKRLMFNKGSKERNVKYFFEKKIASTENEKTKTGLRTALNYFHKFHGSEDLNFASITPQWLSKLEKYHVHTLGNSKGGLAVYLRDLRTVFNLAISDKAISQESYPFHSKQSSSGYKIQESEKHYKAFDKEQLRTLLDGTPENEAQQEAKDFWFFSFFCNGMNTNDLVRLKQKNIDETVLSFVRGKTEKSTGIVKEIEVELNDFCRSVIDKYGNVDRSPNSYLFPVLNGIKDSRKQLRAKETFNQRLTKNFKKYACSLGLGENATMYWARHSLASQLKDEGVNMYEIMEALGHTDLKTTKRYLNKISDGKRKGIALAASNF
jgi:integrase/recombinase XerD